MLSLIVAVTVAAYVDAIKLDTSGLDKSSDYMTGDQIRELGRVRALGIIEGMIDASLSLPGCDLKQYKVTAVRTAYYALRGKASYAEAFSHYRLTRSYAIEKGFMDEKDCMIVRGLAKLLDLLNEPAE